MGTELADCIGLSEAPSKHTWPALIADRLGLDYRCFARGGCGNLAIMDRVLWKVHKVPDAFFVINWTFIDRFDYCGATGHLDGVENGNKPDYATIRPDSSDKVSRFYYTYLFSEYRDKLAALSYVQTVISVLTTRRIKFVMTCVDDLLFQKDWHAPAHIQELQEQIQPFVHNFAGQNFLDWSRANDYEIGEHGHPLERAHEQAADLMFPIIDAILHKA